MRSQNIETSQTSQPASQNGASQPSISAARSHYVDPSQFPNQQAQNQVSFNSSFSPVNPLYNLPMQPQNSFDPERQNAWQEDTAQGAMHFSAQYQPQTGMNPQPDPYSAAFQQAQFTRSDTSICPVETKGMKRSWNGTLRRDPVTPGHIWFTRWDLLLHLHSVTQEKGKAPWTLKRMNTSMGTKNGSRINLTQLLNKNSTYR
ncbi:hypothetical protein SISNIDRAFT_130952 [Sistotremastrum niveocremeum HHB9708]|uniref:Uncharacterized protein n=1 Tax=Sistotremastrum niveocremeum HHB9708 TaxID=1314777 RepID=A0A164T3A7_9AGAM|nr:hypothetical protein SISNIDRAFT_130952 [Sistotremastrum niveocremeum HHB9708]